MRARPASMSNRTSGFALLEVLIALLVMSVGMLGIAGLLLITTRTNTSSIMKQQAVQSAYNAVERIRANPTAALAGNYNVDDTTTGTPAYPTKPSPDCTVAVCSASQLAAYDTWYWQTQDLALLPVGTGKITTKANGANLQVTVVVQWNDAPAQAKLGAAASSPAGNAAFATLVVQTLL